MASKHTAAINLVAVANPSDVRTLHITPDQPITIGRASKSELKNLQPTSTNALFDCPVVSREHAVIQFNPHLPEHDQISIVSMGRHGTRVNGREVTAGRPMAVRDGEVLTLGNTVMRGNDSHNALKIRLHRSDEPSPRTHISTTRTRARGYSVPSESEDDSDSRDDAAGSLSNSQGSSAQTTPEQKKSKAGSAEQPIDLDEASARPKAIPIIHLDDEEDDDVVRRARLANRGFWSRARPSEAEHVSPVDNNSEPHVKERTSFTKLLDKFDMETDVRRSNVRWSHVRPKGNVDADVERSDEEDEDDSAHESDLEDHSEADLNESDDADGSESEEEELDEAGPELTAADRLAAKVRMEYDLWRMAPKKQASPELGSPPSQPGSTQAKPIAPTNTSDRSTRRPGSRFDIMPASTAPALRPSNWSNQSYGFQTFPDFEEGHPLPGQPMDTANNSYSYYPPSIHGSMPQVNPTRASRWDLQPADPYSNPAESWSYNSAAPNFYGTTSIPRVDAAQPFGFGHDWGYSEQYQPVNRGELSQSRIDDAPPMLMSYPPAATKSSKMSISQIIDSEHKEREHKDNEHKDHAMGQNAAPLTSDDITFSDLVTEVATRSCAPRQAVKAPEVVQDGMMAFPYPPVGAIPAPEAEFEFNSKEAAKQVETATEPAEQKKSKIVKLPMPGAATKTLVDMIEATKAKLDFKAKEAAEQAESHTEPTEPRKSKIVKLPMPEPSRKKTGEEVFSMWGFEDMPSPKLVSLDKHILKTAPSTSGAGSKRKADDMDDNNTVKDPAFAALPQVTAMVIPPPAQRRKIDAAAPRNSFVQMAKNASIFLAGGIASAAFLASPLAGQLIEKLG